ncbi:MAG: dienelactone hydrolase family protein [Alphaproteobacteria bacterium]|nr:dienelactone hydrolase family protein [Alphaproteobacteria bacterium]
MAETIRLKASDGHQFDAYVAQPAGKPRGGLVVIQEIFGVNQHMRKLADGFAAEGYLCVTPALFDRAKPAVELGYGPTDIPQGRDIRASLKLDQVLLDLKAAADAAKAAGKVGAVGYCWGGSLAYLCATRLGVAAAVGYYGGQIVPHKEEKPGCPTMLHFGERDKGIPLTDVEIIRKARPDVTIHIYPADHGFNCDERGSWEPTSAKIARERTLELFRKHVG